MSEHPTFKHDTFLYSAQAPDGRLFAKGDEHPGEGWHDHPSAVERPHSLHDANRSDATNETSGAALLAANEKLAELEKAKAEQVATFDASWKELTAKHDGAQAEIQSLKDENKDLRGEIASKDEDIRQLEAKVKELEELIATVDGDGDGKPGGSKSKAEK